MRVTNKIFMRSLSVKPSDNKIAWKILTSVILKWLDILTPYQISNVGSPAADL
jgi:hypothetical protein